jgi:predicted ferric reductase
MLLLVGGWSIPYNFESFSILYKFGKLKQYLRFGKMFGITVVLLLLYQLILAARLKIMEQIFSAKTVLMLHRINGFVITCLVVTHPVLIKASDKFTPYTFTRKYYPEFVGIGLLFVVLTVSLSALFRNFLKMEYKRWRLLHRLGASLVFCILPFHVLFVSDTFDTPGLPRWLAIKILALNFLMILFIWLKRLFQK